MRIFQLFGRSSRLVLLALIAAALGSLAVFSSWAQSAGTVTKETPVLINAQAPGFSLVSLDGSKVSLTDMRGHPVIVNFWATWCVPCRAEMKEIERAFETYREQALVVLAFDELENDDIVAGFVREFGLGFTVLLDRDGSLAHRYNVLGLPTSFFVDRAGIIRVVKIGEMDRAFIESEIAGIGVQVNTRIASVEPTPQDRAPDVPRAPAATPSATPQGKLNLDEFFPPGEGRDLVVETCLACHEILTFGLARKSRDGWIHSGANHANRFPSLSGAQVQLMYEYLVANLNPDFPIPQELPLGYSCGT